MRGLHRLAWRGLLARPLRTFLTTTGVALGVAVLFAGLATNAGIDAAVDRAVATMVGRADLRLTTFGETGLTGDTRETIGAVPGVEVTRRGRHRFVINQTASAVSVPIAGQTLSVEPYGVRILEGDTVWRS